MEFQIVEGNLKQALEVLRQLPEFDTLLPTTHYQERVKGRNTLVLIALDGEYAVGCKVGYDKFLDGSFYSWLGGVIPSHRKEGIAKALLERQHHWAKKNGYHQVRFKTLNRHKAMLIFSLKNGFEIFNVKPKDELQNNRIELVKNL